MFPEELKSYPQWVLWREVIKDDGTRTKLPYSAHNNKLASVTDSTTWATYELAYAASRRLLTGIGFVLSANDPYAFIDLDDPFKGVSTIEGEEIAARHSKILQHFDSYSETSPSGKGVHIIVKGTVPDGKRRNKVEVYSTERYMTMTGATLYDKPIADRNDLLTILWAECGGKDNGNGHHVIVESEQTHSDEDIYNQARSAENGDKFLELWNGHWLDAGYKSQSEADFALVNILGFYSRNVEQIKRLFFASALGNRDKAKRKTYIDNMVQRSFDNQVPYVPIEALVTNVKEMLDGTAKIQQMPGTVINPFAGPLFENVPDPEYDWTVPPGLLGEIAEYVYASAPRQVKEIALAAAIGLMAGICGRAYNVSGTGLNQYVLVLAGTGTGKEAVASGIDKLVRAVTPTVQSIRDFIGPTEIASGQALIRYLSTHPCFVSIVGEFGLTLQAMCSPMATSSQVMLKKKLLELYNKSGEKDVMQPTIYSEKEKNTQVVHSPAFSILGESTPESYYSALDESMISGGLLPRFMCIEYLGKRPSLNPNHQLIEPSQKLVGMVGELATNALMLANNARVLQVVLDADAQKFADEFEKITTANINSSEIIVAKELWNRAHLKMLKLAALIAVGLNPNFPIITLDCIRWAHTLVDRDINNIFRRFESGKIGRNTSEGNQTDEVRKIIKDYISRPYDATLQKYLVEPRMHQDRIIAWSYILRRLSASTGFRNDRMGVKFAIERAVESLVRDGAIMEVRQVDIKNRYEKTMKAYAVTDLTRFTS